MKSTYKEHSIINMDKQEIPQIIKNNVNKYLSCLKSQNNDMGNFQRFSPTRIPIRRHKSPMKKQPSIEL